MASAHERQQSEEEERTGDEAERTSDESPLNLDKRKALLGIVLAVLLAGAAFAGLSQFSGGRIGTAVNRVNVGLAVLALAGQLVSYLGYTLAYRDAAGASGGPRFDFLTTLRIVIFGRGMAILGASVGGLAVDFWALRRAGAPQHVAARRVLAIGTLEWTVLSLYAVCAAAVVLAAGIQAPQAMAIAWICAIPCCVGAAIWLTSGPRVESLINPQLPPMPDEDAPAPRRAARWAANKLRQGLGDALAGVVLVRHLLRHPRRYYGAAIGYPIYWAGDIFTLYIATRAFGAQPDVVALVLAYCTGFVVSSLPLPAGGAGGVEATIAIALRSTGIAWTPALLGVFLYRLITFWLPAIPALALLPNIRRLNDELTSVPLTERDRDQRPSFRPRENRSTPQESTNR